MTSVAELLYHPTSEETESGCDLQQEIATALALAQTPSERVALDSVLISSTEGCLEGTVIIQMANNGVVESVNGKWVEQNLNLSIVLGLVEPSTE